MQPRYCKEMGDIGVAHRLDIGGDQARAIPC
jgi:hypothetical protein